MRPYTTPPHPPAPVPRSTPYPGSDSILHALQQAGFSIPSWLSGGRGVASLVPAALPAGCRHTRASRSSELQVRAILVWVIFVHDSGASCRCPRSRLVLDYTLRPPKSPRTLTMPLSRIIPPIPAPSRAPPQLIHHTCHRCRFGNDRPGLGTESSVRPWARVEQFLPRGT